MRESGGTTNLYKTQYAYSLIAFGHQLERTEQNYTGGAWVNQNKIKYQWDTLARQTYEERFDWVSNAWSTRYDITQTYDKNYIVGVSLPFKDFAGFVDYARANSKGLVNQGWKDSHDSIFHADGTSRHIPTVAREVFDVTGAGDTVLAVLGAMLAYFLTMNAHLGYWPTILIVTAVAISLGYVLYEALLASLRGESFERSILLTLGLSMVLQNGAIFLFTAAEHDASLE